MIANGKLIAEKGEKKVFEFNEGDYFGEVSLIRNTPRQASVKCVTGCKVVQIDRDAFKRMFGSIEDILRRNEEKYKKYISD
jgi:cAMP-dependent protein kinase regulator